eukprot:Gb_25457 [translate_table: standard]
MCAGSSTIFLSPPTTPHEASRSPLLPFNDLEEGNDDEQKDEEGPVKYSYAFFHMSFALASMYSAMLFTSWSSSTKNNEKLIDVGWPSVWVHICTEWIIAVLTTPLIFSTAVMSCITKILATVKDLPNVEGDRLYGIKSLSISLGRKRVFWTCVSILLAMYSVVMVVGAISFVWTKGTTTSGSHLNFRPSKGLTIKMVLGT